MVVSELFIYILIGYSCFSVSMISFIYSLRWICDEAYIGFRGPPHQVFQGGGVLTEACAGSAVMSQANQKHTEAETRPRVHVHIRQC